MQTILGAGGVISNDLAKEIKKFDSKVRLVSRNPRKINTDDELVNADLLNPKQTIDAVKGSDVVYLTAGIKYNTKVWQTDWHQIMSNVINACKEHNSKLVFFDNVYMYGLVDGWMTEETPVNPSSKKGEVRAKIADMLINEYKSGNLTALIARSADFYGGKALNTFILPMVFKKLARNEKASWLVNDRVKHSFTFTPDASKALALLANTETAYNQVWHLPTDSHPLTGEQFIHLIAKECGVRAKYSVLSNWMMWLGGVFNPLAKESIELLYQYQYHYLFDSTKFENKFFMPTTYEEGIKLTLKEM